MLSRIEPSPQLRLLAAHQGGVISVEQSTALGLPGPSVRRLVGSGHWQRLGRGVYLVHNQDPSWTAWAWGGVLVGGDDARLGGLAAGHLWGLNEPPPQIEVLVPDAARPTQRPPWQFVRERPGVHSARSPGEPPRLTVEDAVIDLTNRCTEGEVVSLITKAVQSRRTTSARLARCAAGRSRLRHRRLLLELLADVAAGAESALELRYLRDVERAHALPRGDRQTRPGYGQHRKDVRYERYRLVVELDGRLFHDGVQRFRDMFHDNQAVLAGDVTLRYGWFDVADRGCPLAFQIGSVLIQRGWDGLPQRCDRCRHAPEADIAES